MYEVKRNFELPQRKLGRSRKYPLDECEVGDGFEIPEVSLASCRQAIQYWKKYGGKDQEWTTRRVRDGVYGVKRVK